MTPEEEALRDALRRFEELLDAGDPTVAAETAAAIVGRFVIETVALETN